MKKRLSVRDEGLRRGRLATGMPYGIVYCDTVAPAKRSFAPARQSPCGCTAPEAANLS